MYGLAISISLLNIWPGIAKNITLNLLVILNMIVAYFVVGIELLLQRKTSR